MVFRCLDVFMILGCFVERKIRKWPRSVWEVSGTTPDLLGTNSGPFRTHFDKKLPNINFREIPIKIPHSYLLCRLLHISYNFLYNLSLFDWGLGPNGACDRFCGWAFLLNTIRDYGPNGATTESVAEHFCGYHSWLSIYRILYRISYRIFY